MADHEDGLEIVAIGKLYNGPWEKKYWSSSRGKDRYPYPVGYRAVRTQDQITYTMEILEGLKGPMFMISSIDGQSCSGHTPGIVWNSFQKKGCVGIKLWRGKRLSNKIDGVELFGFKNPSVQRLLRELVSNVNLITEQRLLSSSFNNGASETCLQDHTQCTKCFKAPCSCPNFQPDTSKPLVTRKRSAEKKAINSKSKKDGKLKQTRQGDEAKSVDVLKSGQRGPNHFNNSNPLTSSTTKEEKADWETVIDEVNNTILAEYDLQFDSVHSSKHLKQAKDVVASECNNHLNSRSSTTNQEAISFSEDREFSDRSKLTSTQGFNLPKQVEEAGEAFVPKDSQTTNDMDLFAPDSLDLELDDDSVMSIPKGSSSNIKEELNASQVVVVEDSIAESHAEELVISTENDKSEKSYTDSVGHEIAESMMTILLPRAVPLLKAFSRRKKIKAKSAEVSQKGLGSDGKKEGKNLSMDVSPPVAELRTEDLNKERQMNKANTQETDFGSVMLPICDDSAYIAPDSFEDDQCDDTDSTRIRLFQGVAKADHSDFGQHSCIPESTGLYGDVQQGHASDSITNFCPVINLVLDKGQERKDNLIAQFTTPNKKDVSIGSDDNSICCENQSAQKAVKTSLGPNEETCRTAKNLPTEDNDQLKLSHSPIERDFIIDETRPDVQSQELLKGKLATTTSHEETAWNQGAKSHNKTETNPIDCSDLSASTEVKHSSEIADILELLGCYVHPMPISTVLMRTKGNEMYICVLCGFMEKDKSVFVYEVPVKGKGRGCPSIIGHTSLVSPYLYASGREIALDGSSLQLTPDGQCLVLHNSIKAPYCSVGNVYCPCLVCKSACSETNAVKIVEVKRGYVSASLKLKTTDSVCCILVCEPCYLLAAEESGRLHLWTMNSSWTATTKQSFLPTSDCMPGCIIEMKRIPKSEGLVVGHNAFEEFCLWDITNQILVSKFSAPQISVLRFLPVSLCRFPRTTGFGTAGIDRKEHINNIMDETYMWSSNGGVKHDSFPSKGDDVAVCLLISRVTDPNAQHGFQSNSCGVNQVGCWNVALLARNTLILGNTLDPRAAIVGASAGYGIMSTCDKLLYMWDLSKGTAFGALQNCKGAKVSCIGADDSDSGAFAIACDGGQLQVYMPPTKANEEERKVDKPVLQGLGVFQ